MQTEALRANLERTAVDVEVPPEHLILLEISAGMVGVHNDTARLLREIHHAFVGWPETVPELHRRAMADVYHYARHERGAEGLKVYSRLYAKAAREAVPVALRADSVRWWISFLEKVLDESAEAPVAGGDVIADALDIMRPIFGGAPDVALAASGRLRRLIAKLASGAEAPAAAFEAAAARLREVLTTVYRTWSERDDPAAWFHDLDPPEAPPAPIALISHEGIAAARSKLDGGADTIEDLLDLPDHSAVVRGYMETAEALEGSVDVRTGWLCRVLGEPLLEPIHERALWTLARFCSSLIAGADRPQFERFIGDVFAALRAAGDRYGSAHLDLVRRIGVAVLEGPRPGWADLVISEILTLDFHRPDFGGFTDEWSVRVNPNHLKNIRTYLAIIGANPARASRLLAGLVIHLDSGGVFIADTDLFQKDVSALLASDIGPVYHQVRTLLRRLPVYFSEIGAEGELRDVSTRIDEIRSRRDPVCHFLRKQCHVESNPRLITLTEEIARFWATGEAEQLLEYLPEELHGTLDVTSSLYTGLHEVFSTLASDAGGIDALFDLSAADAETLISGLEVADPVDREKAALLFRLREELARKYSLDHGDLIDRLRRSNRFDRATIDALEGDLDAGRLSRALASLLGVLEDLQRIVLSSEPTVPVEDIYHKRHIGTGIPSMYGSYREPRLDAIGLSYRVESMAGALFDRIASDDAPPTVDATTLTSFVSRFDALARGLGIEGYRTEGIDMALSMLRDAVGLAGVTRDEIADATRGVAHHIHGVVRSRVLNVYGDLFEVLDSRVVPDDGSEQDPAALKASEEFLRNVIAESMSLQRIDNLAAALLHLVNDATAEWDLATGDGDPAPIEIVRIRDSARGPGPLHLGNKAAMLGRLADYGFPIPRGFVIPTGLARRKSKGNGGALPEGFANRVLEEIRRLEQQTVSRFGDADRPLLLSVRGGAPISMPGMLNSFLNVGINPDIARGVAARSGSAWAAWDAYRRFLQFWGMSRGLDRDLFDHLMSDAKERFSAPKKANLTADQMAQLTAEYRALVVDNGIPVVDEPVEQLFSCIDMVIGSWDSAMARVYRGEIGIADGWGTAVIIQNMVYGNLHERSGTGVLLTHHPHDSSDSFELFGDFVIQGQGDDVVSGLVDTFPITERQRHEEPQDAGRSLESDFPAIYRALERLGRSLVEDHGWSHQEMEFTFEGDRAEDLFILQAREAVADDAIEVPVFRSTDELARSRLAVGIGVSGGAVACRVAQDEADIIRLRFEYPQDPVLLVRPDTVPDDIHLLLQADGLLTAIGGATSHAAVVARRLGKTCVVGCRELKVYEAEGRVEIAGRPIAPGDWISISGSDGSVYLGNHDVEMGEAAVRPSTRIGVSE